MEKNSEELRALERACVKEASESFLDGLGKLLGVSKSFSGIRCKGFSQNRFELREVVVVLGDG